MRRIINFFGNAIFLFKRKSLPRDFSPKKILIIRSGAIGDVLMTTTAVRCIRNHFPDAEIDFLVGNHSKDILEGNPDIDHIIPFDDRIIYEKRLSEVLHLSKDLKKMNFDLAVVFDKSWMWGVFAFLSGAKTRIGFDRKGEGFANNLNMGFDGSLYEVDYNNKVLALLGIGCSDRTMRIYPSAKDEKIAQDIVKKNRKKGKIIGIAPGGAKNPGQVMDSKRPKIEFYAKICDMIGKGSCIIIFGSKEDSNAADSLKALTTAKLIDETGKLELRQTAALIGKCDLFITHDNGLMHIAAAMDTPLIAVFGPTQPERFAPKKSDAVIIKAKHKCSPCYDIYGNFSKTCRCIDGIGPEEVAESALKILNRSSKR